MRIVWVVVVSSDTGGAGGMRCMVATHRPYPPRHYQRSMGGSSRETRVDKVHMDGNDWNSDAQHPRPLSLTDTVHIERTNAKR